MDKQDQLFEYIYAYFEGESDAVSRQEFESKLENDPELRKKVEQYKQIPELVVRHRLLKVRQILDSEHARYSESTSGTNGPGKKGLLTIVLTVCLVSSLIGFYNFSKSKSTPTGTITPKPVTVDSSLTTDFRGTEQHKETVYTIPADSHKASIARKPSEALAKAEPLTASDTDTFVPVPDSLPGIKLPETITISGQTEGIGSVIPDKAAEPVYNTGKANLQTEDAPASLTASCSLTTRATIQIRNTCYQEATGKITVSFPDEQESFRVTINHQQVYSNQAEYLQAGIYQLRVTDLHGCQSDYQAEVKEEFCHKDFVLNPNTGQFWDTPFYDFSGILTIFDKNGKIVCKKHIPDHSVWQWGGRQDDGQLIPGYYLFSLHYENGTIYQGSITVAQ